MSKKRKTPQQATPVDESCSNCGHSPEDHSRSGECQEDGCPCACYERWEDESREEQDE